MIILQRLQISHQRYRKSPLFRSQPVIFNVPVHEAELLLFTVTVWFPVPKAIVELEPIVRIPKDELNPPELNVTPFIAVVVLMVIASTGSFYSASRES